MLRGLGGVVLVSGLSLTMLFGCYVPPEGEGVAEAGGRQTPSHGQSNDERAQGDEQGRMAQGQQGAASPFGGAGQGVNSLSRRARQAFDAGDYSTATKHLETALEQEPRHPVLIQNLAAVSYAMGNFQRSERLALRAVSLGGNNVDVLRESWWLVAAARLQLGDTSGAKQARQIAEGFKGGESQGSSSQLNAPANPGGEPQQLGPRGPQGMGTPAGSQSGPGFPGQGQPSPYSAGPQ